MAQKMRTELAHPVVRQARHGHAVGSVRSRSRHELFPKVSEKYLSDTYIRNPKLVMEIRRRKRKWDTLGGGHSWDGSHGTAVLIAVLPI